jgi:signal transduction histidine kinase
MRGAARLRRAPIRLKLAIAVIVPLSVLVAVTSLEVAATSRELDQVRQQTELALATSGPTGLITALQNERAWPAAELVGFDGLTVPVEGYEETRAATDEAIAGFRGDLEGKAPAIGRAYEEALAGLDGLDAIRADIDANAAPHDADNLVFSDSIFVRYSTLLEPFFEATARISLSIGDEDLRHGAGLVEATARQIEVLAQLLNTLASDGSYSGGIESPSEISVVARMRASVERNAHTLRTSSGPYEAIVAERFPAALTQSVLDTADRTVGAGPVENVSALADGFDAPPGGAYPDLQQALSAEVERRAGELNRSAEARQRVFVALAAIALASTVALTWWVSRSITRPLRSLTRQAQDMAQNRLPEAVLGILQTPLGQDVAVPVVEPVSVRTRDEVVDVADALNTVQDTALHLAVEQAVLRRNLADSFLNLGRRNQNLLGRQLDFITELENRETEPDALANLFRLDHLATRMRRNAESLLVLAGIEPPRQWAAPVSLTDVIRAALGEVEDYQQVIVRDVEPATIGGSAATDLAHILAELIENAIAFSRPHQTVDIRGRAFPDSYALAVIDEGIGMPGSEIDAANRRLAGAESFSVAPSKYLGHYVAGNLAIRHGMRAHLESPTGTGLTAVVRIPPHLLAYEAAGSPLPT